MANLELEDRISYQRKVWLCERVGWAAMVVLVALAFAGLFGGAEYRKRTISAGPHLVTFEPVVRSKHETTIDIQVGSMVQGESELWLSSALFEKAQFEELTPAPSRTLLLNDGYAYRFDAGAGGEGSSLHLRLKPEALGVIEFKIRLNAKDETTFKQIVLP